MTQTMIQPQAPTPPLKWHGGKQYLASRIIETFPPHLHYVEAFAGGLAVMLAKNPEGVSEVANDLNGWLTNFWSVLRDPALFSDLSRFLQACPFSESLFEEAREVVSGSPKSEGIDPVKAAAWFFVCCRQSMSGRMKSFTPTTRNRTRRNMNAEASAWLSAIEGLPEVHARLSRVLIFNKPAVEVIRQQDGPNTLFYLDPPYLHETRVSRDAYAHEMTADQHRELLDALGGIQGWFVLSGYDSELYRESEHRHGWHRQTFDLPNNSAGGESKRRMIEVVWANYSCRSRDD